MNITFNEVSVKPYAESSHSLKEYFKTLLRTYGKLKSDYQIENLIFPANISTIEVLEGKPFIQWVNDLQGFEKSLILSSVRKPYCEEVLEDYPEDIDSYIFKNDELNIKETICTGLGLAHICDTAAISLATHLFWKNNSIGISVINYDTEEEMSTNVNNCCLDNFSQEFIDWIESVSDIQLIPTTINYENKTIRLRDDHGKDVLQTFAEKILKSNYLESVINSLPFNPTSKKFVRKCYSDGRIEIVLHWTDSGIGIVLQSTGRNYYETAEIAKLLQEEYDR